MGTCWTKFKTLCCSCCADAPKVDQAAKTPAAQLTPEQQKEKNVTTAKTSRATMINTHTYMLLIGVVIGTIGSFGRMDYNIPQFAFELIRQKYFNSGWLGDKAEFSGKGGLWYSDWKVVKTNQAVYPSLEREIYFQWHSRGLLAWSVLVDVWWFFYVVWYIWASDEWKALASWENNFHWVAFSCGAACFLLKIAYFLMLFIEDIKAECAAKGGCGGWCQAFWCCAFCKASDNPLEWPTCVKEQPAPAPAKKEP